MGVLNARRKKNWDESGIRARKNLGKMPMSQMTFKINQRTKLYPYYDGKGVKTRERGWWGRDVIRGGGGFLK